MTKSLERGLLYCLWLALPLVILQACESRSHDPAVDSDGHTAPTEATLQANNEVRDSLDFADRQDFEDATRGLIATDPELRVSMENGDTVWDMPAYGFIGSEAPGSVNPSLWRQAQLNNIHGLFEVTDGVYQLRGFDLSNMTIIDRDRPAGSSWIP